MKCLEMVTLFASVNRPHSCQTCLATQTVHSYVVCLFCGPPRPCPTRRPPGTAVQPDDSYAGHIGGLLYVEGDLLLPFRRTDGS